MKILLKYLKPHKWLVVLTLVLACINIGFSLFDPIILGKLINLANTHQSLPVPQKQFNWHDYLFLRMDYVNKNGQKDHLYGVIWLLTASITVAMVSRIAKNFQDYFLNVIIQKFGDKVFTEGLQHAMKLP
ncbi:MAG: transporter ATP-binding protein [Chitinophagaceae bacterium]|nr:transporter ATP-binding protein [Chitinophagaceae bacterium]